MRNDNQAAATPEHIREIGVELRHSARQTERTVVSIAETIGAMVRDGGLAILGLGDVAVQLVRALPKLTTRFGTYVNETVRAAPQDVGEQFEHLCERGQEVVAQLRHDAGVHTALQRTQAARRRARQAVRSVKRAAEAQAAGVRRSAAALGRRSGSRYRHMTVGDLRTLAARRDIDGRSQMRKDELIRALRH